MKRQSTIFSSRASVKVFKGTCLPAVVVVDVGEADSPGRYSSYNTGLTQNDVHNRAKSYMKQPAVWPARPA